MLLETVVTRTKSCIPSHTVKQAAEGQQFVPQSSPSSPIHIESKLEMFYKGRNIIKAFTTLSIMATDCYKEGSVQQGRQNISVSPLREN